MLDKHILSKYILLILEEKNITISNLKLQRILYLLYKEFYKEFNKEIAQLSFVAKKLGPVEKDIYKEYQIHVVNSLPSPHISVSEMLDLVREINDEEKTFIMEKVLSLANYSTWDLNEKTRQSKAWKQVYQGGIGLDKLIPNHLILRDEVSVSNWFD